MSLFPKPWGNYLIDGIVETTPPDMVSLWPQTIGWQLVFIAIIGLIGKKVYDQYMQYKRNAYRRDAIKLLNQLTENADNDHLLKKLPALLRTTALYAFDRQQVSNLTASKWEHWLDKQCPESQFSTEYRGILQQLAFAPGIEMNASQRRQFIAHTLHWVTHHRREDNA